MSKVITYKVPALDKKGKIVIEEKQGKVAFLYVGPHRVKFVLQLGGIDNTPLHVVHYASGNKMPGDLNQIRVSRLMGRGTAAPRLNDRDAAQQLINRAVDKAGVDRVMAVINAANVINK